MWPIMRSSGSKGSREVGGGEEGIEDDLRLDPFVSRPGSIERYGVVQIHWHRVRRARSKSPPTATIA